jgi:hypothetical protein
MAWSSGPFCLLARFAIWLLPAAALIEYELAAALVAATFFGLADGWFRLWISRTSRSLLAEPHGLTIASGLGDRVVFWADLSAIQTWRGLKRVDYLAVHYRNAGRIEVATCWDQNGHDELVAFVRACAAQVCADTPQSSITLAGLSDPGVYLPLFQRFIEDVAVAAVVGWAIGAVSPAFLLGLFAASLSAGVAAIRHPFRTTTLVQQDGLWCSQGLAARPLCTIPRALRLWVESLAKAGAA